MHSSSSQSDTASANGSGGDPEFAAAADAASVLVDDLADVVKVSSLYPSNNVRVQRSACSFLAHCQAWVETNQRTRIRVRVLRDRMAVDQHEVVSQRANFAWLQRCMEETALGGLAIYPETLEIDTLLEFAQVLRQNVKASSRAHRFADLWEQQDFPGLVPLERLFIADSAGWQSLPPETRAALEEDSVRGMALRSLVEASDDYAGQLAAQIGGDALGSAVGSYDGADQIEGIDMLRRIVDLMPEAVQSDQNVCTNLVESVIEEHSDSLRSIANQPIDLAKLEMRRVLLDVSTRFFARNDFPEEASGEDEAVKPKGPQGHAGDDQVTDDIDAFLAEFLALPDVSVGDDPVGESAEIAWSEAFAAALRVVFEQPYQGAAGDTNRVAVANATAIRGAESQVRRFATRLGPTGNDLLRTYLENACLPNAESADEIDRLAALAQVLERTGLLPCLLQFQLLTPSVLSASFPKTFSAFLNALDDSESALARLLDACELIGQERFLEIGAQLLDSPHGGLPSNVLGLIERAGSSREVMPLVRFELLADRRHDEAAEVRRYLGGLGLRTPEAEPLRVLDASLLPRSYLLELCEFELGIQDRDSGLKRRAERMIKDYLAWAAYDEGESARCVRAIGSLRMYWGVRTAEFVQEMLRGTGWLRRNRPPKPIRAALETLMKTRKSSS